MVQNNTSRQFWVPEPGRGEIRTVELESRPRAGHVRVRTLFSAVSRGTESLVFRGRVPPSQHRAMRAPFQEGSFPGPVKYGYMSVGEVVAVSDQGGTGQGVEGGEAGPGSGSAHAPWPPPAPGTRVYCLHPHQDLYDVPADAVVPVPGHVPPERAVLAANLETAVNAVWDGAPTVGDRIAVVGGGVVGLCIARLCRSLPGAEVTVVDVNPARRSVARALGCGFREAGRADVRAGGAADGDGRLGGGGGADVVFHASGTPEGLASALGLAGDEATVVEVSWFGDRRVPLPLGEDFHSRRLTLRSSQVGGIPPGRARRWTHRRRLLLALELLGDSAFDALITGESPFEELPEVMDRLSGDPGDTLCHRIRYGPGG